MGRYVRPAAGVTNLPAGEPIRLLDATGRIVGVGTAGRTADRALEDAAGGRGQGVEARRDRTRRRTGRRERAGDERCLTRMRRSQPADGRGAGDRRHCSADLGRLFIVVGVFDGLHLGHLYLLGRLREEAARRGARPAVVTFDHHPDEILTGAAPRAPVRPRGAPRAPGGRRRGRDRGAALRRRAPDDRRIDAFIRRIADRAALAGFLMTPDSAFGHERRGTPEAVAALGRELGYDVAVIPSLDLDGRPVRSAEIRSDIAAGDLAAAARLLGRPYAVVGEGSESGYGRVDVTFPMPVAVPPAGEYPVSVGVVGSERTQSGIAIIGPTRSDHGRHWVARRGQGPGHLRLTVCPIGRWLLPSVGQS